MTPTILTQGGPNLRMTFECVVRDERAVRARIELRRHDRRAAGRIRDVLTACRASITPEDRRILENLLFHCANGGTESDATLLGEGIADVELLGVFLSLCVTFDDLRGIRDRICSSSPDVSTRSRIGSSGNSPWTGCGSAKCTTLRTMCEMEEETEACA